MKTALTFLLAISLASGVALADNPTDAPLASENSNAAVAQQPKGSDCAKRAKKMSASGNKATNVTRSSHAKARQNSVAPAPSDSSPIMGPMFQEVGTL